MRPVDARIRDLANDARAVAWRMHPRTVPELAVMTELLTLADRLEHVAKLARMLGHNATSRYQATPAPDRAPETAADLDARFARSAGPGNGAAGDSNPGTVSFLRGPAAAQAWRDRLDEIPADIDADDLRLAMELRSADREAVTTRPAGADPSLSPPPPDGIGADPVRLPARSAASPSRSAGPVLARRTWWSSWWRW